MKASRRKNKSLFLVTGSSRGKKAWYYVLIDRLKLPLYEHAIADGQIDLLKVGDIICSGFGENPPADIARRIKAEFS